MVKDQTMFPVAETGFAIGITLIVFFAIWSASYLLVSGSIKGVRQVKEIIKGGDQNE